MKGRAVYSYKPVVNKDTGILIHYKPLSDSFFKLAKLSIKSVSRFYTTHFYTDSTTAGLFHDMGLKFDEVIILDKLENTAISNYALPKIYAMMEQTSPFVMFDFDTIITEQLQSYTDLTYAYYEIDLTVPFPLNVLDYLQDSFVNPYINTFSKYYNTFFPEHIDWRKSPNFSTLMVNDSDIPKLFYKDILNQVPIDVIEGLPPTLIEQFLLHQHALLTGRSCSTFINSETDMSEFTIDKIYHVSINNKNFENFYHKLYKLINEHEL